MKIKLSRAQWEGIGNKAGWINPELEKLSPMGPTMTEEHSIGDPRDPLNQEEEVQRTESRRLFQQLLKEIEPSVIVLADRFFGEGEKAPREYVDQMRYYVLDNIRNEIEDIIKGKV